MSKDYIGVLLGEEKPDYLAHYGIPGMKWGVRRSKAQLRAGAAKKDDGDESAPKKPSGPETSGDRYRRLLTEANRNGANSLSEEDLKFVNARTDAIKKVNQLASKNPNWLADAAKEASRNATKQAMNQIAAAVADKYITKPLMDKADLKPPKKDKDKDKK